MSASINTRMDNPFLVQLISGTIIGLGAGYLGAFMVLRRMSLVGDALSHVALPGIAVALLFGINPFLGAFAALLLGITGVWLLEKNTTLPSETLVGIFFTVSLALGILLTPQPELLEALFGDIANVTSSDMLISGALVVAMFIIMVFISRGIVLGTISKDLAQSAGIKLGRNNYLFLLLVAVIVALGLKVAGTLLMGSLVIIPAAAAKNISQNLSSYTKLSALFGAIASFIGIYFAGWLGLPAGAIVVLSAGAVFLVTLPFKR